jgi:hypothetical protein
MQLDSDPQGPRSESFLIPFDSRPVTPLQDHTLTVSEQLLGQHPQLCFEEDPKLVVPHVATQLSRPVVLSNLIAGILGASRRASVVLPEAGSPQISTSRVDDVAMHEFYMSPSRAETEVPLPWGEEVSPAAG